MPYQGSLPSYDEALNPTKAEIAKHTRRRGLFGRKRCVCGKRWRSLGCEDRVPKLIAYLLDSTEAVRADDLKHHPDLFTTFEAEIIAENDQRSRSRRDKVEQQRRERERESDEFVAIWQESYPEPAKPQFWHQEAPTGTHEIIWQPAQTAALVPQERRPLPRPHAGTGAFA